MSGFFSRKVYVPIFKILTSLCSWTEQLESYLAGDPADYKNLTWVWGMCRKICPKGHSLALRGSASDAELWPEGQIWRYLMWNTFSCTLIGAKLEFNQIYHNLVHIHVSIFILTCAICLKTKLRDIHYYKCFEEHTDHVFIWPTCQKFWFVILYRLTR